MWMLIFLVIIVLATPSNPGDQEVKAVVESGVECGQGSALHSAARRSCGE